MSVPGPLVPHNERRKAVTPGERSALAASYAWTGWLRDVPLMVALARTASPP